MAVFVVVGFVFVDVSSAGMNSSNIQQRSRVLFQNKDNESLLKMAPQTSTLSAFSQGRNFSNGAVSLEHLKSYSEYVEEQQRANIAKIKGQWVPRKAIKYLSRLLRRKLIFTKGFGICHGTRQGNEQRWFHEFLGEGVKVIGTEISNTATMFPNTIKWDFHAVKDEWIGAVDFIYTNALDHSFNPKFAVSQWAKCLTPQGVIILEWTSSSDATHKNKHDIFGANRTTYEALLIHAGLSIIQVVNCATFHKRRDCYHIIGGHAFW